MKEVFTEWSTPAPNDNPDTDCHVRNMIILGGRDDSIHKDLGFLSHGLYVLREHGVMHGNAGVSMCDFKHGDDFVRDAPYADLIFLSWVNMKPIYWKEGTEFIRVSPLLSQGHSWKGALEKANPKYIVNFTDNSTCVPNTEIPEGYTLVGSDPFPGVVHVFARRDVRLPYLAADVVGGYVPRPV